jgi:hypothetical protein
VEDRERDGERREIGVRQREERKNRGGNMKVGYTVKKVSGFPVPSRDVTNQTLPGRE